MRWLAPAIAAAMLCSAGSAQAQSICTLTVTTTGALGMNTNGKELSSQAPGGIAAVVTPVIIGLLPTITLSEPRLTDRPGSYNGQPTVSMSYRSLLGGYQDWTSTSSRYRTLGLTDVLTIDMKVTDPNGFRAGSYAAATTLTCQR